MSLKNDYNGLVVPLRRTPRGDRHDPAGHDRRPSGKALRPPGADQLDHQDNLALAEVQVYGTCRAPRTSGPGHLPGFVDGSRQLIPR